MKRPLFLIPSVYLVLAGLFWVSENVAAEDQACQTEEIPGIVYKTVGNVEVKLNLFLPVRDGKRLDNAPLLIWLDSGGWESGEPGNGGLWRKFRGVEKGFAVASVAHRSVSTNPFPAPIEDVKAAVRFLRAHSKDYGLDPTRFFSCGASSGGHLATMLGIADSCRDFDVGENLDQSSQVQRVVNLFSTADIALIYVRSCDEAVDPIWVALGYPRTTGAEFEKVKPEILAAAKKFSPITYVTPDFAPTLTLHGVMDALVPVSQSAVFYEALKRNGVPAKLFIANEGFHNIDSMAPDAEFEKLLFDFIAIK